MQLPFSINAVCDLEKLYRHSAWLQLEEMEAAINNHQCVNIHQLSRGENNGVYENGVRKCSNNVEICQYRKL